MNQSIDLHSERLMSVCVDTHPWPSHVGKVFAEGHNYVLTFILPNSLLIQVLGHRCSGRETFWEVLSFIPRSWDVCLSSMLPHFGVPLFSLPLKLYTQSNSLSLREHGLKLEDNEAYGWFSADWWKMSAVSDLFKCFSQSCPRPRA